MSQFRPAEERGKENRVWAGGLAATSASKLGGAVHLQLAAADSSCTQLLPKLSRPILFLACFPAPLLSNSFHFLSSFCERIFRFPSALVLLSWRPHLLQLECRLRLGDAGPSQFTVYFTTSAHHTKQGCLSQLSPTPIIYCNPLAHHEKTTYI